MKCVGRRKNKAWGGWEYPQLVQVDVPSLVPSMKCRVCLHILGVGMMTGKKKQGGEAKESVCVSVEAARLSEHEMGRRGKRNAIVVKRWMERRWLEREGKKTYIEPAG